MNDEIFGEEFVVRDDELGKKRFRELMRVGLGVSMTGCFLLQCLD